MLWLYRQTTRLSKPLLKRLLAARVRRGKEDHERLNERFGVASRPRPDGALIWLHAASVGEAQSLLRLVDILLKSDPDLKVLMTTGTVTSARILEHRLDPARAVHQYIPLDHPDWTRRFLDHWKPQLVLWAESELWPNMLSGLAKRDIPAALVNARLSPKSYAGWKKIRKTAARLLDSFHLILTQTDEDTQRFRDLGARSVITVGNIKYAANPLPVDQHDFNRIQTATNHRPRWIFASTHDGEEDLAAEIHKTLAAEFPGLLTIIVPRHPERGQAIADDLALSGITIQRRAVDKDSGIMPDTGLYIADTLGELGLFYALGPIAVIGRSFSLDGGGGHNPIESALLGCATLTGPNVQNLTAIYDDMERSSAVIRVPTPETLCDALRGLLANPDDCAHLQKNGLSWARNRAGVLGPLLRELEPVFIRGGLPLPKDAA